MSGENDRERGAGPRTTMSGSLIEHRGCRTIKIEDAGEIFLRSSELAPR
jgi:hypothetical protein